MWTLIPAIAVLLIALIYLVYDQIRQAENRRRRVMHERVAELLWAAAQHGDRSVRDSSSERSGIA